MQPIDADARNTVCEYALRLSYERKNVGQVVLDVEWSYFLLFLFYVKK